MLAQITDKALEKVAEASAAAAANAPTHWVQMLVSTAGVVALCWVVKRFLESQSEDRKERAAYRDHMESMTSKVMDRDDSAWKECHAHSIEMMAKHGEDSAALQEVTKDLKVAVCKVEGVVHDAKTVVVDSGRFVEMAMQRLAEKDKPAS